MGETVIIAKICTISVSTYMYVIIICVSLGEVKSRVWEVDFRPLCRTCRRQRYICETAVKVKIGGADKFLARPTSRCILFDGENISFDASLVIYIYK